MAMRRGMVLRDAQLLESLMQGRHTNRSLARAARCHPSMIGHLRTGKKTSCRPALARRITRALGVTLDALFVAESELLDEQQCPDGSEVMA